MPLFKGRETVANFPFGGGGEHITRDEGASARLAASTATVVMHELGRIQGTAVKTSSETETRLFLCAPPSYASFVGARGGPGISRAGGRLGLHYQANVCLQPQDCESCRILSQSIESTTDRPIVLSSVSTKWHMDLCQSLHNSYFHAMRAQNQMCIFSHYSSEYRSKID